MLKRLTLDDMITEFIRKKKDHYSYWAYEAIYKCMAEYIPDYEIDVIKLCGMFDELSPEEVDNAGWYTDLIELKNGNYLVMRLWSKDDVRSLDI